MHWGAGVRGRAEELEPSGRLLGVEVGVEDGLVLASGNGLVQRLSCWEHIQRLPVLTCNLSCTFFVMPEPHGFQHHVHKPAGPSNKSAFYIKYPASSILLQHQKAN